MSKQQLVSEPLDEAPVADLDKLASEWGCTREHIVATAVLRFLSEETGRWPSHVEGVPPYIETDPLAIALNEAEEKAAEALEAFIKVGEDAADRGELIPQEKMERWFAERVASRARAQAAE